MKYGCRKDTQTETEHTQLEHVHLHPFDALSRAGAAISLQTQARACFTALCGPLSTSRGPLIPLLVIDFPRLAALTLGGSTLGATRK